MSFDGFVAGAIAKELNETLEGGKIEKIYQPDAEDLLINIHANRVHHMLYISAAGNHSGIYLIQEKHANPQNPSGFCMLMRKHLQGGRIQKIVQKDSERIIEIYIQSFNEMGYSVNKRLIVEIMGKHSNIVLVDQESGKIMDSIKRISFDVNRYRQLLPGQLYVNPPDQGKIPFYRIKEEDLNVDFYKIQPDKLLMEKVQGLSPTLAYEITEKYYSKPKTNESEPSDTKDTTDQAEGNLFEIYQSFLRKFEKKDYAARVYLNEEATPVDFHIFPLNQLKSIYEEKVFPNISEAVSYYYSHRDSSNKLKQKSGDLQRAVKVVLDKLYLKKQRLSEDILKAENADIYRLYGELLTANLHAIKSDEKVVTLLNYYNNEDVKIQLDPMFTPSQNAQRYYKKYNKSKTAIKEKNIQLEEAEKEILYLESVLSYSENAVTSEELEELRNELIEVGYLRRRKNSHKSAKTKSEPYKYATQSGLRVLVGRNNKENDQLTFKLAGNKDIWFHTKDIPGSHVILFTEGKTPSQEDIYTAASLAALHSKGKNSENVPVDYTFAKYVKKPNGAKPGMVIFTDNKTVYVNPFVSPI